MHNNDKNLRLLDWLGLNQKPDLSKAKWLGPIITVILTLFATILLLMLLGSFLQAGFRMGPYSSDKDGTSIRNIGLVLAALLGLPFIIWRSIVAAKQVRIADEALFNDKINDAAQGLLSRREISRKVGQIGQETIIHEWEDDLVARAAAIDRLEGLANERSEAAPRIAKLLATYIRGNFPCHNLELTENINQRTIPRMDLQKSIDTLGKVNFLAVLVDDSEWRLDLKSCNFDGVNFSKGYFRATDFTRSRFETSIFRKGNFEGCLLYGCLLNHGDFMSANLRGVKFDYCILNRPIPVEGGMTESINFANLYGSTFISSDISALDYIGTVEEISKTFGTANTVVSDEVSENMPIPKEHTKAYRLRNVSKRRDLTPDESTLIKKVEDTGFQNWSPFQSSDMSTGHNRAEFYDQLDMNYWPFQE